MALRLIEMVLSQKESDEITALLKPFEVIEQRQVRLSDQESLFRILLEAEKSEELLDALQKRLKDESGVRVVILPVEATLPHVEEKASEKSHERIDREELYENIKTAAKLSKSYFMMIFLSTIVAAAGLLHGNVTYIIGAMLIAPMLGPNMALSLGTTLGDLQLVRKALVTSVAGISLALALSVGMGYAFQVDPNGGEIAARVKVGLSDLAVAFSSGCAGAIAFTQGLSATLIGVMVAVAVLPPLVAFGLLLGNGDYAMAWSSLLLFSMNLICVNLAGVVTFIVQGIHPANWWEKDRAAKATGIAITLWVLFLGAWILLLYLTRRV